MIHKNSVAKKSTTELRSLTSPELDAICAQAWQYTYRIHDKSDLTNGGTGVDIKIGTRYFIATAEHILRRNHKYEISPGNDFSVVEQFVAMHKDEDADIGVLEFSESVALAIGLQFLDEKNVLQKRKKSEGVWVLLEDYPGEYVKKVRQERIGDKNFHFFKQQQFMHVGRLLSGEEWPETLAGLLLSKRRYLLIRYCPSDNLQGVDLNSFVAKTVKQYPPKLDGMSGCGIWLLSVNVLASGIWKPDARLIGIQRSFNGIIRGTQISKWVTLLRKEQLSNAVDVAQNVPA